MVAEPRDGFSAYLELCFTCVKALDEISTGLDKQNFSA